MDGGKVDDEVFHAGFRVRAMIDMVNEKTSGEARNTFEGMILTLIIINTINKAIGNRTRFSKKRNRTEIAKHDKTSQPINPNIQCISSTKL